MELKIGDIVEFKKYKDMNDDERMMIIKDFFPLYGKAEEINVNDSDRYFSIAGSELIFCKGSVVRVINDIDNVDIDIDSLNKGDEVLVKATVETVFNGFIQIEPSIEKTDVIDILKRKEPEYFIVKEDYYGMYIGTELELVIDKSKAKIYTSRDTAVKDAAEMFSYDNWEVIHV